MTSAALELALKNQITNRLLVYEQNRAENVAFVGGGWISDPIEFTKRSTEIYGGLLTVARDYQADLRPPAMPIPVAAAMQALFTRFALLWHRLGPSNNANSLNAQLVVAIDDEVHKFVKLMT